jgi:hypothetical protein
LKTDVNLNYIRRFSLYLTENTLPVPHKYHAIILYFQNTLCVTMQFLNVKSKLYPQYSNYYRPQWPSGLRRGCTAVRLLGLKVGIPPMARTSVFCERSGYADDSKKGRSLVQMSHTCCRVTVCHLLTSKTRRLWPSWAVAPDKKKKKLLLLDFKLMIGPAMM